MISKIFKLSTFALFVFISASFVAEKAHALCSAGDKAQVLWKGSWYPATVIQGGASKCYIHYDGYSNSWDEWVGPGRIKVAGGAVSPSVIPGQNSVSIGAGPYKAGDAVMVKWKGSWWPAQVVQVGAKRWYIHYDGYSNSWDEWVGPGRIRPR